jgi:site-specific recombinase XerD
MFTTEAFRPFGLPVPGVPMLLDGQMRLVEAASVWLMHVALVRGRTRSPQTWRVYGEALYDWWQTLEANGWAWDRIGLPEIAAYRDHWLSRPSPVTGRPYARSTINGRLRVLGLFYRWCAASGLIPETPFAVSDVAVGRSRPAGLLAHVDASGGVVAANALTLRQTPALPRALTPSAIRAIVAEMEARDRLIVEWAVMTGARRMEIAGLRVAMLPRLDAVPEFAGLPVASIRLDVTKGGKRRFIYPPLPLLDRTRAYVREERAVAVRRARERDADYRQPEALFLTASGRALTGRRIGARFSEAAHAAGVEATFHGLRHTFAGAMLRFLQHQAARNPDLNPLLTLQTLMGHADLATTAVYLRMLATDLSAIETTVDELYGALGAGG